MPFVFSKQATLALPDGQRCVEDRRNNPVPGRTTKFRLLQQNIIAYTFPFVPGFTASGINSLPFASLVQRALDNAQEEGDLLYGRDFEVQSNALAKVAGDIFEELEAAVHWNVAARWNRYMRTGNWPATPRYPKPSLSPSLNRQVAFLSLPRRYDWVNLLDNRAKESIFSLRADLEVHGLSMPTSTPDMVVAVLPEARRGSDIFAHELEHLGKDAQSVLDRAYLELAGTLAPDDIILAIALKKSLRSDRLYQPLYEANVMQLLLEGRLGATQVDFEVHTLTSAGTAAKQTYRAASLARVATAHALPHRAVRELYETQTAGEIARRFLVFLNHRMDQER